MNATPAELIRRKRNGEALSDEDIAGLVTGMLDGSVTEAQIAAFAMVVYFRGMTAGECLALTRAMTRSGTSLDWSGAGLDGPILDKHSTGGIGDTVSLILAPVIAACGGFVPMVSGRGLGHTGGTLDKMAGIPGYDATPDLARFRAAVRAAGCAIVGQTADLAPADRRIYAVRDVTATHDSLPLIAASILSKKLAAGLDALVLDVKVGSGALLPEMASAVALGETLVAVANGAGLPTLALLTDMTQPLGREVGNTLEVRAAVEHLTGRRRGGRLHEVTAALAAELLVLGGLAPDQRAAGAAVSRALDSGAAAERFGRMVAALGGPTDLVERPERHLAVAPARLEVAPDGPGTIVSIDARAIGVAVIGLGGGRRRAEDPIDPTVGLSEMREVGDAADATRPIGVVHARSAVDARVAAAAVRAAVSVGDAPPPAASSPVLRRFDRPR